MNREGVFSLTVFLVFCLAVSQIPLSLASYYPPIQIGTAGTITKKVVQQTPPITPARIVYFQSSFAYEGTGQYSKGEWWPGTEPAGYPNEKGIWHWVVVRRYNIPCGGNMRLVDDPTDPTRLCLEMVLNYEGTRPLEDLQHCKLYELQHLEPENYPEPYTTAKEAYYSFKVWVPEDWAQAEDWKLFWQICGEYGFYGNPEHHVSPQMSLSFQAPHWGNGDAIVFGLLDYYYADGQTRHWKIIDRASLPKEKWVRFDIFVKQGSAFQSEDGTVIIWMDGTKVFERHDLPTATPTGTPYVIWSIGNYGSRREPYGQRILFRDIVVSSALAL